MRAGPFVVLLICLIVASVPAIHAEEPAEDQALLEAVVACPLSLRDAMSIAYGTLRDAIDAEFLLDAEGRLLLRVTVRVAEEEESVYESWIGRVHAAGWVPRKRALEGEEAASAARRWAQIEGSDVLRLALMTVVSTEDRPAPADVALSVGPGVPGPDGKATATLRIGVDGAVKELHFRSGDWNHDIVPSTGVPERVSFEAAELPEFTAANGTWFNTEAPPALEGWRGSPVLVVITDPG